MCKIFFRKIYHSGFIWLWISALIIAVDRWSKLFIQKHFSLYDDESITSFFNLTLAYNKGAAFSFLDSASGWQVWIFGLLAFGISLFLLHWLWKTPASRIRFSIALTCIIGGALGNLWDRLCYGHVIDFLDFHLGIWHWPVFNIADSGICLGAFLLIWDTYRHKENSSSGF